MLRLGVLAQKDATSPVAVGQELAAIWPQMICRRVDKLDPSTSHPCFKNRICQICRNKFITYIKPRLGYTLTHGNFEFVLK